jgi:hypothetical protein
VSSEDRVTDAHIEQFAARHGVPARRVREVLDHAAWVFRRDDQQCLFWLHIAALRAGGESALEIFESESDADRLIERATLLDTLLYPLTPLYTIEEVAGLTKRFLDHLDRNRRHLLETGLPLTSFNASPWLHRYLTNLYFVKVPLAVQDRGLLAQYGRIVPDDQAQRDTQGNYVYSYTWVKESLVPHIRFYCPAYSLERPTPPAPGPITVEGPPVNWFGGRPFTVADQNRLTLCDDYKDAGLMDGMTPEDADRLERHGLRERFLTFKVHVLTALSEVRPGTEPDALWEACHSLLTSNNALRDEDPDLLMRLDKECLESSDRPTETDDFRRTPNALDYCNGGISDLLTVIGHYMKELALGTMDKTAEGLDALSRNHGQLCYFKAASQSWREDLDMALDKYLEMESREQQWWADYEDLVNTALGQLPTPVLVPRRYKALVPPLVAAIEAGEPIGLVPQLGSSSAQPAREREVTLEGAAQRLTEQPPNVFRKRGQKWEVIYAGKTPIYLDDERCWYYLAYLLRYPKIAFRALDLRAAVDAAASGEGWMDAVKWGDITGQDLQAGASFDRHAIFDYQYYNYFRQSLHAKTMELERANHSGAPERVVELKEDIDDLRKWDTQGIGLGGKKRFFPDDESRAVDLVRKHMTQARKYFRKNHRPLFDHLERSVKQSGASIVYDPEPIPQWETQEVKVSP